MSFKQSIQEKLTAVKWVLVEILILGVLIGVTVFRRYKYNDATGLDVGFFKRLIFVDTK